MYYMNIVKNEIFMYALKTFVRRSHLCAYNIQAIALCKHRRLQGWPTPAWVELLESFFFYFFASSIYV